MVQVERQQRDVRKEEYNNQSVEACLLLECDAPTVVSLLEIQVHTD